MINRKNKIKIGDVVTVTALVTSNVNNELMIEFPHLKGVRLSLPKHAIKLSIEQAMLWKLENLAR